MLQDHLNIAEIVAKAVSGTASALEEKLLERWLDADSGNREIYDDIVAGLVTTLEQYETFRDKGDFPALRAALSHGKRSGSTRRRRIAIIAAAAVLVPVLIFTGMLIGNRPQVPPGEIRHMTSVARLILDDGSETALSPTQGDVPYGALVEHEGVMALSYQTHTSKPEQENETVATNRIVVPRGCDYRIVLSDGTLVYLNANTEIEFPVRFPDGKREVHVKGQAYFNVARDERSPFVVKTSRSDITVLGTEFDVCDYPEQANQTTLVRGSVAVMDSSGDARVLSPGQQAEITGDGMTVRDVHTMLYTSWKDGYFMFKDARVADIMEKLSQWYDSQYVISDPWLEDMRITARLKKYDDISSILDVLSMLNELDFRIEGKTVIVYQSLSARK